MKIAVITDVHANLPALQAALTALQQEGYDAIFHTGDAIGIGPFPAECLDLLLNTPNMYCVMGNHDALFTEGLPAPQPGGMSDGERRHQQWTHAQLDPRLRAKVAQWPYWLHQEIAGVQINFLHYGLDPTGHNFAPIIPQPTIVELDTLFAPSVPLVFYGHHHPFSDKQGLARYINPGSLGCHHEALARYSVVTCQQGEYRVGYREVAYHDAELARAFEERQVPEREFIKRVFFGGRF